ncbi:hypothetical protein ECC02_000674 [Trypanosoma cruzi]|uniref:non-specific serine/threonine protein kinase n=1 Tax=Trypanosoma cruzi TaxID=5693 RepID=A0A7J6YHY9_TRYCR|nr:hypothetical protein ECC02_000674 [Trypanosoma cruzi]
MNALDELNLRLGIGPTRPHLPITLQRSGYSAVRRLGKGSFGNAYLVYHAGRKQQYVVKHVNMASMTARQRRDAHQEIVVLQQLEYPNIIRYVEFCEEHPHLYIVMEYADGGDVYTHLKNLKSSVWALGGGGGGVGDGVSSTGGLTEEQVISLFVQTTMAVKYMHDRRLLHRDIKSQNVFLTQNHVVKLGDFGISTVLMSTVAMAQTMCGTPCYFSPELCQGKPYNNKSDVWALGVLLYELCTTGRLPFEATTMNRLMGEICKKEPRRIPSRFSDELWNLILWMLKKDPRQRPDAGQILRSPVLLGYIPNIIKKLSATDGHPEDEFRRVLTGDATPPTPIRPAMDLQLKQLGKETDRDGPAPSTGAIPVASAAAAAAVAAAGRQGFAQKRHDQYPFKRMNDDNAVKDRVGGILGMLAQQRQQIQKMKEEEEAMKRAPPANQPPLADPLNYVPVLLQRKQKLNKNGENVDVNSKSNKNDNCNRNDNDAGGNTPKKEKNIFARTPLRPPKNVDGGNLKRENGVPHVDANKEQERRKKAINHLPLQDLFLLYDESKKRILNEKEQRLGTAQQPMNYQPAGATPARMRPAVVELQVGSEAKKQSLSPVRPNHPIHSSTKAFPYGTPSMAEEKSIPIPPIALPTGAKSSVLTSLEKLDHDSNTKDDRNRASGKIPAKNEPTGDLALVLKEMTNHLESMRSSAARAESNTEAEGPKGTPGTNSLSAVSAFFGVDAVGNSPFPASEMNVDQVGEEFSDAMGTTLNVQELQRQRSASSFSHEEVNDGAAGEFLPLCISRYNGVWSSRGGRVAPAGMTATPGTDKETSEGRETQPFHDIQPSKPGISFPALNTGPNAVSPQLVEAVAAAQENEGGGGASLFTGGCLCDGVHFTGLASAIFGSFVCNCFVCSRCSGALMGVEWLHLPDVPFEGLFADEFPSEAASPSTLPKMPIASPVGETSAGSGVSAEQFALKADPSSALRDGARKASNAEIVEEEERRDKEEIVRLPELLKKFVVQVPVVNEDGVETMGEYTVYFCGRCGSTVGMDHDDVAGGLVAKAMLSEASLGMLELFQKTMPLHNSEALTPRKIR